MLITLILNQRCKLPVTIRELSLVLTQLQEQLAQEVKTRKKIEAKLEALKTIEESMTQRRK